MTGKGNRYIAIVDDDESVCRSFGRLLRTVGYQPITYQSAEDFLEDGKRPLFDCIVLDMQLEGLSGLELSRHLSAIHDPTPIIFITAQDNPDERKEAEASGCAAYFQKTDPGGLVLEALAGIVNSRSGGPHRSIPQPPPRKNHDQKAR